MALDPHSINSKEATIAERRLPAAETLLPPSHQMYSTALSARAVEKLSEVALLIGLEISLSPRGASPCFTDQLARGTALLAVALTAPSARAGPPPVTHAAVRPPAASRRALQRGPHGGPHAPAHSLPAEIAVAAQLAIHRDDARLLRARRRQGGRRGAERPDAQRSGAPGGAAAWWPRCAEHTLESPPPVPSKTPPSPLPTICGRPPPPRRGGRRRRSARLRGHQPQLRLPEQQSGGRVG